MTENCTEDASIHFHQQAQAQRMMDLFCFAFAGVGVETPQPWTPAPHLKSLCELNLSHSKTVKRINERLSPTVSFEGKLNTVKNATTNLTGNKHSMQEPSGNNHLSPNLPGSPVTSLRPPSHAQRAMAPGCSCRDLPPALTTVAESTSPLGTVWGNSHGGPYCHSPQSSYNSSKRSTPREAI